jgi:hypothetical protein
VCCAPRGRNLLQAFGLNKKLDMLHGRADFQKVGDIDKMLPEGTIDSAGNVEAKKPKATNCREYVDFTLNEPTFTPLATFISNVVLIAIVVSTLSFVVGTVPYMQTHEYSEEILEIIEIVVVSIFTVEYVLRFLVCPTGRCAFVLSPLNMVDLLAILPFYLEQFGSAIGGDVLRVLRVLRVVRIFRVFKLAKYAESMQMFAITLVRSVDALKLLGVFFGMAVLIFSSLLFYAEKGESQVGDDGVEIWVRSDGEQSPFDSIPGTFWWAVVTMTTVGYGDTYPVEPAGKIIATVAMIAGVFVLALPLSVIGQNFADAYTESLKAKAYATMADLPNPQFVNLLMETTKKIDEKKNELEQLLSATSYAMSTKSNAPAAKALCLQFDLQQKAVKDALDGVAAILSNKDVLAVILGDAAGSTTRQI